MLGATGGYERAQWLSLSEAGLVAAVYNRLRDNGKPAKVALLACMRKLATILNATVRDHLHVAKLAA